MTQTKIFGEDRDRLPAAVEALTEARTEDAMFVAGPDYRVRYWDARTELITAIPATEAVGRPLHEALDGEREDGTPLCGPRCPMLKLARAGRCVPYCEARLLRPSGKEKWVGVSVLVADTAEGPYLIGLLRDTQRMHETLELARALLRSPESMAPGKTAELAPKPSVTTPELSPRQMEVLGMLDWGESVKSIACQLGIAEATVRGHVQGLLQAFGARSQIEVLARARQVGLLAG